MTTHEDNGLIEGSEMIKVIASSQFMSLPESSQHIVLNSIKDEKKTKADGGLMGKILGNKKENAAMHIALIICFLLVLIGITTTICDYGNYWDTIIASITMALGYIFGKGIKE